MNARKRIENSGKRHSPKKDNNADMEVQKEEEDGQEGDGMNIALLFFLYLLQGIPLGLTAAIPMILQNRGASYKQQAEFSFVYWPFSLKLLWAPIVDSCFSTWFGRRKTWLIPTQYLLGIFMLLLSGSVDSILGSETDGQSKTGHPNVAFITFIFFCLNFLAATQDIAVDGWALTMLKRSNVGHASTCNSVGQTAGYFFGYVLFMALESADFCNSYIRSEPEPVGILTLSGFLWFWGIVFLVTTTLVAVIKSEQAGGRGNDEEPNFGLRQSYSLLWDITRLPSIRKTMIVLLTSKIAFSACDAVTGLKLVEAGVPKEKLALIAVPLVPLQIVLPLIISKYTAGPRPMDVYLKAIPYRLAFGLVAGLMVWVTPYFIYNGEVSTVYYVFLVTVYAIHQVSVYSMFVAVMAFFARVSDPAVGGTYMTLLNTLSNLGGNWPTTLALWFVDSLTWRNCLGGTNADESCVGAVAKEACVKGGGDCISQIDGYYIESLVCVLFGVFWLRWGRRTVNNLQSLKEDAWQVFIQPKHKN